MKLLQALRERKKKRLRHLELSEEAWRQIGEIHSYALISTNKSSTNEEIVEGAINVLHGHLVKKGRL